MSAWLTTFDDTNRVTVNYNVMQDRYARYINGVNVARTKRKRTIETVKYVGVDLQYGKDQAITLYEDTNTTKAWIVPGQAGNCSVFQTIETYGEYEDY